MKKDVRLIVDQLVIKSENGLKNIDEDIIVQSDNPWDAAHEYKKVHAIGTYVEPDINNELYGIEDRDALIIKTNTANYLKKWPSPPDVIDKFVWHLSDEFSELRKASTIVWNKIKKEKCIKVAHIDTGYQDGHPALPEHLDTGISFVDGEEGKAAVDESRKSFAEQDGHGTATMSILAGKQVQYNGKDLSYTGKFGAIPFAEIIPIRISDTVALIRSQNFTKAIEFALQKGCQVISMSMAGAPTKAWADVVNKAYEKGVTMVTAAGNSWNKGPKAVLPKRLLYPARWDRVIAATGATANHMPYIFDAQIIAKSEGGETMQGNYGPNKAMKNAIAGYTPNTPWATMNDHNNRIYYRLDGGGTSSATPQIAAAAALWLSFYREELDALIGDAKENQWKRVEAVKYALYTSADKATYEEWEKYYGQGILKASRALEIPPNNDKIKKAKKAKTSLNGILDLLGILIRVKGEPSTIVEMSEDDMYCTEIMQLLHNLSELQKFLDIEEDEKWDESQKSRIKQILLRSPKVSGHLKKKLATL